MQDWQLSSVDPTLLNVLTIHNISCKHPQTRAPGTLWTSAVLLVSLGHLWYFTSTERDGRQPSSYYCTRYSVKYSGLCCKGVGTVIFPSTVVLFLQTSEYAIQKRRLFRLSECPVFNFHHTATVRHGAFRQHALHCLGLGRSQANLLLAPIGCPFVVALVLIDISYFNRAAILVALKETLKAEAVCGKLPSKYSWNILVSFSSCSSRTLWNSAEESPTINNVAWGLGRRVLKNL